MTTQKKICPIIKKYMVTFTYIYFFGEVVTFMGKMNEAILISG